MDSKISSLNLVETVTQDDVLPIVNNGETKKVKVSQLNGKTNLTPTQTSTNFTINSDTGTDAIIPLGNGTLAGASLNDYTTAEKSKLAGIAAGAEVNVNADWNATSGDAQILNKPTIPIVTGFVPYTGATTNVDLGEFELKAGQVSLDITPTGTPTVGTTQWNDNLGSSETTLKGGTVVLKNGVDLVARVVNKVTPNTTLTKANYSAVRISGAQGQRLAVELARANNDANSVDTIGLVTETIATNQEGFIITMGQIEDINTTGSLQGETWVDGDVLYLSPTTAGRLTNIKPTGLTGHIVVIGYVEYSHAIQGKIYVKVMNGWELDELHNVYIDNTLANEDFLQYESSTELWKNKQLTATLIRSKLGITTLSGSNTGDNATNTQYSGLATSKQDTLQSTVNIKSVNGNSLLGSGDLTVSASTPSQSAFTILANNTNASAVPTEQVYKEVAEKSLSGTGMIATGGTLPTGTNTHFYMWSQVGNLVTVRINLQFGTAGTCSGIAIPFANMPDIPQIPQHPSIYATALDVITHGSGNLAGSKAFGTFSVGNGTSAIRIKTTGAPNTYEFLVGRASGSYNNGWIHIEYYI
jgi:nitrogen fixation protein